MLIGKTEMVMIPRKTAAAPAAATPAAATPAATPVAAAPSPTVAPVKVEAVQTAQPEATAAAPAASAQTAVAPRPANAVAVAGKMVNPLEAFKDAFRLDWNTLHRIQANQGNFLDLEANKAGLGSSMGFELMSYQDNWQISPGTDDPADKEHVRYSDDGVVTTQGEDCKEYLQALIASGRIKASMKQRVTLAGTITKLASRPDFEGKLIQIDLSSTSRALFMRYQMQATVDEARGKREAGTSHRMILTTAVQSQKDMSWTVVNFAHDPS